VLLLLLQVVVVVVEYEANFALRMFFGAAVEYL